MFTPLKNQHFGQKHEQEGIDYDELLFESMKDGDSLKLTGLQAIEQPKLVTIDKVRRSHEASHALSSKVRLPPGFVHGGDIKLFGMELPAKLYKFVGELAKAGGGVREMVTVGERILLKEVLKGLNGSLFGDVPLMNPSFTYEEAEPGSGKTGGLHFKAEILFQGALADIRETLKNVFGLKQHSSLSVGGFLAATREWTKPLAPPEMALSGAFLGIEAKMGDLLTFTSVGVELAAVKREGIVHSFSSYHCRFGFFGTAQLDIPGSVVPLAMEYSLKEEVSGIHVLQLKKEGGDWINVGGFKGLNVCWNSLSFQFSVDGEFY